jgi:hypothetical protein
MSGCRFGSGRPWAAAEAPDGSGWQAESRLSSAASAQALRKPENDRKARRAISSQTKVAATATAASTGEAARPAASKMTSSGNAGNIMIAAR